MEIKKTSSVESNRIFSVIYGQSGIGKTSLAGTLDHDTTLIINTENGLMPLKDFSIDHVEISGADSQSKIEKLKELVIFIKRSDYETIFIDSLSDIAEIFLDECKRIYPDARNGMQKWGLYAEKLQQFIKLFRDMTNVNVFMTCLEKSDKDEVGRMFKNVDLSGSTANKLPQYFDLVMAYRFLEKDDKVARVLQTGNNGQYIAKDRSGKLNMYERPNLNSIINKIFNTEGVE